MSGVDTDVDHDRRALPPLLRTEDDDGQSKKKKNEKNCQGHSRLCSELRTKKKNHRGHGRWRRAGVHGPTAVDSTISPRSLRCPLRAPAAASPRHQHLAAVCLLQRYPLCSPAHRRIGSGCCVHSLLLSRHAASARSAFTFSTRLSSTLRSCSHPCPHHCSRPWPDGSGPRARSSQVNHRVALAVVARVAPPGDARLLAAPAT